MSTELTLLYGVTIVILVGTLIVWVVQYRRMYGKRKDDEGPGDDPRDGGA